VLSCQTVMIAVGRLQQLEAAVQGRKGGNSERGKERSCGGLVAALLLLLQ
jgi:hypothetical protein